MMSKYRLLALFKTNRNYMHLTIPPNAHRTLPQSFPPFFQPSSNIPLQPIPITQFFLDCSGKYKLYYKNHEQLSIYSSLITILMQDPFAQIRQKKFLEAKQESAFSSSPTKLRALSDKQAFFPQARSLWKSLWWEIIIFWWWLLHWMVPLVPMISLIRLKILYLLRNFELFMISQLSRTNLKQAICSTRVHAPVKCSFLYELFLFLCSDVSVFSQSFPKEHPQESGPSSCLTESMVIVFCKDVYDIIIMVGQSTNNSMVLLAENCGTRVWRGLGMGLKAGVRGRGDSKYFFAFCADAIKLIQVLPANFNIIMQLPGVLISSARGRGSVDGILGLFGGICKLLYEML